MYATNSSSSSYITSSSTGYNGQNDHLNNNSSDINIDYRFENQNSHKSFFVFFASDSTYENSNKAQNIDKYMPQSGHTWIENHYQKIYNFESRKEFRLASVYMTTLMHYEVRREDVSHLNDFFRKLDLNKLSRWSLIALLRSTNTYKHKISLWKYVYLFTFSLVENEGLNPKRELYGLDRGLDLNNDS